MKCTVKLGVACLVLSLPATPTHPQDVPGIEICTRESRLDRRTSCLQSNVNFLQRLMTKNALEAGQRLNAAETEISALKTAVTNLQTAVQEIKAAQKPASDKKTDRLP